LPATEVVPALVELRGQEANALAGLALEIAADATGDGVADLLVGAPGAHEGRGRALLLAGPFREDRDLDTAELVLEGELAMDRAGDPLAADDLDGDGVSELVIGAVQANEQAGAVYIVRDVRPGRRSLADAYGARISGSRPLDNLGQAVAVVRPAAGAAPVVLAGVPHAGATYQGAALLFRGAVAGAVEADGAFASVESGLDGAHAGTALSGGCDTDGDRASDLLVGAWGDDDGATGGAAYLLRGPIEGTRELADAEGSYVSVSPGAAAGTRVLLADLDDDGSCDVLIGAPGEADARGAIYGFFAPASGRFQLDEADFRILGAAPGDHVGQAFAAGDQDGDGVLDLFVGAPGHDAAGSLSGALYVVYGPPSGAIALGESSPRVLGLHEGDQFGAAIAAGADLDGDGSHDVAIGAWGREADADHSNSGAVFVLRNLK
jgi:hypothetical protein